MVYAGKREKSFYLGEEGRKKAVMLEESLRTATERREKLSTFSLRQLVTNGKVRARIIEIDEEHGRLRVRTAQGRVESWGPDFVTIVTEEKQGEVVVKKPTSSPLARAEDRRVADKKDVERRLSRIEAGEAEAASKRTLLEKFKVGDRVTNGKKYRGSVTGIDFEKGRLLVRVPSGKVFSWRPDFVEVVPEQGNKK